MVTILLAVTSAVAYGVADFVGGVASRQAHVLRVVAISAPASLGIELLLLPFLGAEWSTPAIAWGALSGVASALAFALLYRTLAVGPMTVLAPLTAVVTAVLPMGVGVATGDHLTPSALAGIPIALCAIVLVAASGSERGARVAPSSVLLAGASGAAIAAQLVTLDQAPHDSGLTPLIVGRAVSSLLLLTVAAAVRQKLGVRRPPVHASAAAGCIDSLANLFFLLAARAGNLSISAVIVALYPASTVLLAWIVLRERVAALQRVGLATAAVALMLLARP